MNIKDLSPNPDNPRVVTDKKLAMLKKAMVEFGDLGGIVFNRRTKQLVGGHQRIALFKAQSDVSVTIEHKYKKPTKTGTVAEGYLLIKGEKFSYREVDWDTAKEKAANLAANKGAGDWDKNKLKDFMVDIKDFQLDLDLTMFDSLERVKFFQDEKPAKKKDEGRVSSSAVKQFQLAFTEESAAEFAAIVEYFQKLMNSDSVSDTVLEILRLAKTSSES